jgi:hypothetical protein
MSSAIDAVDMLFIQDVSAIGIPPKFGFGRTWLIHTRSGQSQAFHQAGVGFAIKQSEPSDVLCCLS